MCRNIVGKVRRHCTGGRNRHIKHVSKDKVPDGTGRAPTKRQSASQTAPGRRHRAGWCRLVPDDLHVVGVVIGDEVEAGHDAEEAAAALGREDLDVPHGGTLGDTVRWRGNGTSAMSSYRRVGTYKKLTKQLHRLKLQPALLCCKT